MEELGRRAARGAGVTVVAQVARVGVQMLSVVVLARLLTPADYGVIAMVLVVVGVGEVVRDLGLSTAAVRTKDLTDAQRSNLFWANTLIGTTLTVALLAGAPLVGMLFGRDDVVPIARYVAVVFLLNGLTAQLRADLQRRLRFGALAAIDVGSQLLGATVAVVFAVAGAGVAALAAQQVVQSATVMIACALLCRWIPSRPRRGVPMAELWRFGGHLAASQIAVYIGNNVDALVIGTRLGPTALGLYDRAYRLVMTPVSQVRAPTTTIALPVLTRLVDEPARLRRYLVRAQLALAYPVMVGAALLVGTAGPATAVLLGEGWDGAAPLVRFMATSALLQTLAYVGYWVYLVFGLSSLLLRYTLLTVALKVVLVVLGSTWGVVGVAAAYTLAHALEWPLSLAWLSRHAPLPGRELARGAGHVLGVGLVVGLAAHGGTMLIDGPAWLSLGAGLLAGAAALGAALAIPWVRRDATDVVEVVRAAVSRRR
ncbi:lipopolysaccharide biosynthesis protein [Sanguibacter sp. A247]|uniref:lipopolysaccharide biosynthesis protein n=1 Tax=unclassified Sanguibacter TaxID=2645534 RepID=UPI003FD78237